ncbi:BBP7 family outer membrane beta-barrel protein [Gemmata sp. JC717]|uniref:BBP7 family outer membrane beta-barrel protein n=1 Tax=Gemmata algarum TaxID=2975278 RepID=UPI0021BAC64F|nr:BBP7 family outer membrane beta-barrel protein [Gemmata algarum]MDY3553091.1 BBP7 family outer membrane beta-barrel protein [Gemmata algarum]
MKRFRVKAIGLGLALTAGSALSADGDWRPVGAPPAPPAPRTGEPGLLPAALRAPPVTDSGVIWLPVRGSAPAVVQTAAKEPQPTFRAAPPGPVPLSQPAPPPSESAGPRGESLGPLPAIPELPNPGNAPGTPEPPVSRPDLPVATEPVRELPAAQPEPVRPKSDDPVRPKSAEPPMMNPPQQPGLFPDWKGVNPLPIPRPVPQGQPQPELEPAPAELMYPAGAFDAPTQRRGTFGSPPVRLSRDYPPLREVIGNSRDLRVADELDAGLANRFFARAEYLQWWLPGFATPVLATTNANTALNGYLGEPGTTALVGPGAFLDSTRSGFRFRAGAWLDDAQSCGIDAGFFFLGNRSGSTTISPDRFPLITRPIYAPNLVPGTNQPLGENGEAVAVPDILRGALTVEADSRLWGADVNARWCWIKGCAARSEVFAGYRHLNLRESLTIRENITVIGSGGTRLLIPDPIGTQIVVQDRFATRNQFHGGQVGMAYERRWGRWDLDARASVALGATHQELEISGSQVRRQPGGVPVVFNNGGLLAAGPNLGRFERDKFSVAPEFTLNIGYWVTPNFRVFGGYNFLYWSNVIRPGDQIDHVVDLTFVPNGLPAGFSGQYRPRPLFKQSDLAINGLQFGVELRW